MNPGSSGVQVVVCGLGGQGVVFVTRLLAEAAMVESREVLTAETHGMSQRGGAVESFLKIGAFAGPLVRPGHADAALVLDADRLPAARRYLRPDGVGCVNTPLALPDLHCCDAAELARQAGRPRDANLVLAGFAVGFWPDLFPTPAACLSALERLVAAAQRPAGLAAFHLGLEAAERASPSPPS